MNICAVISEFNPFHNGHEYLISKLREKGASHIVTIMTGNFTQRGDVSIVSKAAKTKMALSGGADLVIELPTNFSLSPAEKFAKAAVFLIKAMGCVSSLGFGCECDDINKLVDVASKISFNNETEVKKFLKDGLTFSKVRQKAMEKLYGSDISNIILKPNNILAIEYIRALKHFDLKLDVYSIKRNNVCHDDDFSVERFTSSSFIRKALLKGDDVSSYIPKSSYNILLDEIKYYKAPAFTENGEKSILTLLRTLSVDDLLSIQDFSEGLENRVYKAIKKAKNIDELYFLIKTKRYTLARIRRLIFSSFLGLNKDLQNTLPPYIRILGFNKKGMEILKEMKKTAQLPIITRHSDIFKYQNDSILKFFNIESKASDLYSFFAPKSLECGQESISFPVILNK